MNIDTYNLPLKLCFLLSELSKLSDHNICTLKNVEIIDKINNSNHQFKNDLEPLNLSDLRVLLEKLEEAGKIKIRKTSKGLREIIILENISLMKDEVMDGMTPEIAMEFIKLYHRRKYIGDLEDNPGSDNFLKNKQKIK